VYLLRHIESMPVRVRLSATMPETFIIHDSDSWLSIMNRVALSNINRAYDGEEWVVIDQSIEKSGISIG
jgi:hypothetical protein